jgi:SHS2 domain-containing protein
VDEVTSDLACAARGATLEDVFAAAAEALLAATLENPEDVRARSECRVELEERDLELLLLRFLNDLVWRRDAEGLLLRAAELRVRRQGAAGPWRLEARLAGEGIDRARHRLAGEVKAATAHGLRVAAADGGYEARFTFDV